MIKHLFISFYFIPAFFIPLQVLGQMVPNDPYAQNTLAKPSHVLPVRILNHGLVNGAKWIEKQIAAAEIIFYQCGKRIELEIRSWEELPHTQDQDSLLVFKDDKMFFSEGARNIFNLTLPGKEPDVLDVHIVDHLNGEIRRTRSIEEQELALGQAFNPFLFGALWHGAAKEAAGQRLFVAQTSVELAGEKRSIHMYKSDGYSRHLSLLAHEIGHFLFEITERSEVYKDHWCHGLDDSCPFGNLMSAGGNTDMEWRNPRSNFVVGYEPMPKLTSNQCELMFKHPLLKKI